MPLAAFDEAAFASALAAEEFGQCLDILAAAPGVQTAAVLTFVEEASQRRKFADASMAARQALARATDARGALPARLLLLGARAALRASDLDGAAGLIAAGRARFPTWEDRWSRVASEVTTQRTRGPTLREVVTEARARGDWAAAFSRVEADEGEPGTKRLEIARARALLFDWTGVLRLEAETVSARKVTSVIDLGQPHLLIGLDARIKLGLAEEARDLIQIVRERGDLPPAVALREADAHRELGDARSAVTILLDVWKGGGLTVLERVVSDLLRLGETEACRDLLDSANRIWTSADRWPLIRAESEYLADAQGPGAALRHILDRPEGQAPGRREGVIARYAADAGETEILEAVLRTVELWRDEGNDALFFSYGANVVLRHFFCILNWKRVSGLVADLGRRDLPPIAAAALAGALSLRGDLAEARRVVERSLRWFPSVPTLWRSLFAVLGRLEDQRACADARARMYRCLPRTTALDTIIGAEPRSWDEADIPELLTYALSSSKPALKAAFLLSLRRVQFAPEAVMEALDTQASGRSGLVPVQVESLLAQVIDRHLLESSVVKPISIEDLRASARNSKARTAHAISTLRNGESETNWHVECFDLLARVEQRCAVSLVRTAESLRESIDLTFLIIDRIRARQPTSILRIGDGEGNFLSSRQAEDSTAMSDRQRIQRVWWGERFIPSDQSLTFQRQLKDCISDADIVGIAPVWRVAIQKSARAKNITPQMRGLYDSLKYLSKDDINYKTITSCHFHDDLSQWNLWREIFANIEYCSWISCHSLNDYLWPRFGVRTRQAIRIPPEVKWANHLGQNRDDGASDTLLDRHDLVCEQLAPIPGEVYLVAAGFLGKLYCGLIRSRGGIAIDIGSIADYWMGFATRGYRASDKAKIHLGNTFIRGIDRRSAPPPGRVTGRSDAVRSTWDGRFNIADGADAHALRTTPREKRLLRVIGHPRCASGYMATLFAEFGIEIGHERLLRDGTSNWQRVVDDFSRPFGEDVSNFVDFDHTVLHVRDPQQAIPSIILENGIGRSFDFRRQHILRARGDDIARYETPEARAVASFVHWYAMADALLPEAVFRVEDGKQGVETFLSGIGALDHPPADGNGDDDRAPHGEANIPYNASVRRFGAKPTLTADCYLSLPDHLLRALETFCARHRYDRPWDLPASQVPAESCSPAAV